MKVSAPMSSRAFWLGVVAYMVPSFVIAYPWHLTVFAATYKELGIFRDEVIVPFGLLSMLIQGVAFSFAYPRVFADRHSFLRNGLAYGLAIGLLSWSFTTLAASAKNVMTSVPIYLALETGFTLLQFVVVGPLIALAHRN